MKIAVYTITKNEEKFIERWASSCKDADYRIIVDTGSTDDTVKTGIEAGCDVYSIVINPWRFDDARNASLALVPDDADYCIALDADEVLTPGWREAFEKIDPIITRPRYKYVWSWNSDGSEGLVYHGDKIHARKGYRWRHPVHEVITPINEELQGWVNLEIHHYPDNTKSRSQYLPLLELAVKERPEDDRNQFYLGREYMFNNMYDEAKKHLLKHLELSTWKAERSTCMRYLGRVTGDKEHWLLRACAEAPDRREPWVELSRFYYEKQSWPQCYSSALRALQIQEKPLEYLCEAESWGSLPHDLCSIASWNLGLHKQAVDHGAAAFAVEPGNARLKNNLSLIYGLCATTKVSVIIPTKSNISGLIECIESFIDSSIVEKIYVVADGNSAYNNIKDKVNNYQKVVLSKVKEGSGIHVMWNKALRETKNTHCLFLNDDVQISAEDIKVLSGALDMQKEFGLICPNYDARKFSAAFQLMDQTCRGRYDGTGGLAGFCMMLSKDLTPLWSFDESMKWWYGDDDLLNWTTRTVKKQAVLTTLADCSMNASWTINNDPPKDFASEVNKDKEIFMLKWAG